MKIYLSEIVVHAAYRLLCLFMCSAKRMIPIPIPLFRLQVCSFVFLSVQLKLATNQPFSKRMIRSPFLLDEKTNYLNIFPGININFPVQVPLD